MEPFAELALVYAPTAVFSVGELAAMSLDKDLVKVYGDAYRCTSIDESPQMRAAALMTQVPASLASRAAIGWLSAAWVYGAAPPPQKIDLLVDIDNRTGALPSRSGCRLHEVKLPRNDLIRLGGTLVTSTLRTAVDVACTAAEDEAAVTLRTLAAIPTYGCHFETVLLALKHTPHRKGRRRALALVARLCQPAV